jgi:hypothetical protein
MLRADGCYAPTGMDTYGARVEHTTKLEEAFMTRYQKLSATLLFMSATTFAGIALAAPGGIPGPNPDAPGQNNGNGQPLVIKEQGSFMAGGTVLTNPDGNTFHGDHLYAFYQIPTNPRKLPLVMLHGAGQFSKTWETTPDGREGYQNIFLRRGFSVYIVDQPRRGDAGRSTLPTTITPSPDENGTFGTFRLGIWPNFFPGVQFNPAALDQYWRQQTPNTGPFDLNVISSAFSAMFDKIGPGIMITHSQGGGPGWYTRMATDKVRAVVAYEPGSNFPFPVGQVPAPIPSCFNNITLPANAVPMSDFLKLTGVPIIIFYGDNIPDTCTNVPADQWRIRIEMARLWRDALNARGGDVTVVHLPDIGIHGNTHFAFSDLNNVAVADVLSGWLKEKGLDQR